MGEDDSDFHFFDVVFTLEPLYRERRQATVTPRNRELRYVPAVSVPTQEGETR